MISAHRTQLASYKTHECSSFNKNRQLILIHVKTTKDVTEQIARTHVPTEAKNRVMLKLVYSILFQFELLSSQ